GVLLHGNEGDRDTQTILKFFTTLPDTVYGVIYEVEAAQARYIPEDDRSAPLRGGWLLRDARVNQPLPDGAADRGLLVKLADAKGFPPPFGETKDLGGETYFLRTPTTFQALTRRTQWYWYASTVDLVRALYDPSNDHDVTEIAVFLHNRILRSCMALAM